MRALRVPGTHFGNELKNVIDALVEFHDFSIHWRFRTAAFVKNDPQLAQVPALDDGASFGVKDSWPVRFPGFPCDLFHRRLFNRAACVCFRNPGFVQHFEAGEGNFMEL